MQAGKPTRLNNMKVTRVKSAPRQAAVMRS
jgi:hypothetical protein